LPAYCWWLSEMSFARTRAMTARPAATTHAELAIKISVRTFKVLLLEFKWKREEMPRNDSRTQVDGRTVSEL